MIEASRKSDATVKLRQLGRVDYVSAWDAMQHFTQSRTSETPDEFWLLEHMPVYTMGLKGRGGTVNDIHDIPVVYSDRGGDMTYHGPGQIILYVLLDIVRLGIGIKTLVNKLEQAVMDLLAQYSVSAQRRAGAPGIYIDERKIAALGLRVRNHCAYHGLALNVDMDLRPFTYIDPCGYPGMEATQLANFGVTTSPIAAGKMLATRLSSQLGYNKVVNLPDNQLPDHPQHG